MLVKDDTGVTTRDPACLGQLSVQLFGQDPPDHGGRALTPARLSNAEMIQGKQLTIDIDDGIDSDHVEGLAVRAGDQAHLVFQPSQFDAHGVDGQVLGMTPFDRWHQPTGVMGRMEATSNSVAGRSWSADVQA
jgi:hypothetical protein